MSLAGCGWRGGARRLCISRACLSGVFTEAALLPEVVWRSPRLELELFLLQQSGGDVYPTIRVVILSGKIGLSCGSGWGVAQVICAVAQCALAYQLTAQARAEIEDQLGRLHSDLLTPWVSSTAAELLSGAGGPLPAVHGMSADGTGVRILFCVGRPCR